MKVTEIFNYEVKVMNEQNGFILEARVRIDGDKVQNISNGTIKTEDGVMASFDCWNESNLNFNVYDSSKTVQIITEILSFIEDVKTDEKLMTMLKSE